jgi:ATP-dependent Clp protease ATP-binding subunit ClpB
VIFNPLGKKEIEAIVDLQMRRLQGALTEQRLTLELSPEARAYLGEQSYDPAYGARPVKRALQRCLRDPLSELILGGGAPAGSTLRAVRTENGLRFDKV